MRGRCGRVGRGLQASPREWTCHVKQAAISVCGLQLNIFGDQIAVQMRKQRCSGLGDGIEPEAIGFGPDKHMPKGFAFDRGNEGFAAVTGCQVFDFVSAEAVQKRVTIFSGEGDLVSPDEIQPQAGVVRGGEFRLPSLVLLRGGRQGGALQRGGFGKHGGTFVVRGAKCRVLCRESAGTAIE